MKTFKKVLSIFLCVVLLMSTLSLFSFAQYSFDHYYIDSIDGDDANDGKTAETAVKTIAGLKDLNIGPGTQFLFRNGGVYDCEVTLTCDGTKEMPVVITSYGDGERAILKTDNNTDVFRLFDCSYITISDLHIKAENGGGIWIDTLETTSVGITLDNILFTDMQNYKVHSRDDNTSGAARARAAVIVKGLPARSRYAVNDLTITDCEVYNCANGFLIWGSWNDSQSPWCEEDEIDPVYNTGLLIKDCYFHEMDAEAVIVGMCDGALVTDCRAINCCQGEGLNEKGEIEYFTAAMWFWGSENSTIQYCEIAGQKNFGDGMAVDFDSHTNNCTYQYIYSHDNMRFMCNNPNYSGHYNNTVRYCLSVNDNKARSTTAVGACGEHNFRFYNNTIINSGEFQFKNLYNAYIANNIFTFIDSATVAYDVSVKRNNTFENNCYYNVARPLVDLGAMNKVPGFVGNDYSDITSFVLSADSPLIGAGSVIDNNCTTDFFGNEITSNNIGCYGGDGADTEYEKENIFERIIRFFKNVFATLYHEIYVIFN